MDDLLKVTSTSDSPPIGYRLTSRQPPTLRRTSPSGLLYRGLYSPSSSSSSSSPPPSSPPVGKYWPLIGLN